jgi:hypothetical protein
VAIDFGGSFEREANFFKDFEPQPYILETNFRQLKLDRNSWTFMGSAALLFSDYLNASDNVFGTIYEATTYHFASDPGAAHNYDEAPFNFVGLKSGRYTNGLTEIATALIVMQEYPQLVESSLNSLASEGSAKKYRKALIAKVLTERFGIEPGFKAINNPTCKTMEFGHYLADDFLTFYLLKHAGIEEASKLCAQIPENVIEIAKTCKLNFYERINTIFIEEYFPAGDTRGRYLAKLADYGILPYNENDYKELEIVKAELRKYHKLPE